MAAIPLREEYDCVVIGNSRTASLVAGAIARSGRSTLQLNPANKPRRAWLHPRWTAVEGDESQRSPLSGVSVVNSAGQRTTVLRATAEMAKLPLRAKAADSFTLPAGCQMAYDAPREIWLNGALPPTTIRAGLVIAMEDAGGKSQPAAIGGVYRDVACDLGDERQALLFATQRAGEVFWLVPFVDGRWSLGLLTDRAELLAEDELADLFEEALVACPALIQRLMAAELIGGLHLSQAPSAVGQRRWLGAVRVPEYDNWHDPVFASSDWLGAELARQVALQLSGDSHAVDEQLTRWQQEWSAVEQLTSERIAPWYRLHDDLPSMLHDHAQRTWFERLLAGQRAVPW